MAIIQRISLMCTLPFEHHRWAADVGVNTFYGAANAEIEEIVKFQRKVYDTVDREITAHGIEHNENGDRALSYIYCVERISFRGFCRYQENNDKFRFCWKYF